MQFSTNLGEELRLAQIKKTKKEWVSYCAYLGILLFAATAALGHAGLAPLTGVMGFVAAYKYPWYRKKEIAGGVEKELPLALRSMATLLSIGLSFEEALRRSCGESKLAVGIGQALREISYGLPMPEALNSLAARFDSRDLQKAVMQLNSIYRKRSSPLQLKKLSEEIVAVQKAALQEYSGKLVVNSLVFVAVSAIVPALFQAYVIVGSSFMTGMVTAEQAFWIPVAAFPLVDAAVLAVIRLKKPFFA